MTADLRDHSFSDLAAAIMGILDKHRGEKGLTLLLPPGRFSLVSETAFSSPSIAHDDGSGEDISKTSHILIRDMDDLTIEGSTDDDGNPATVLIAHNDMVPQKRECSALWAENCRNLKVCSITVTRDRECCFSADVLSVDKSRIRVRLRKDYGRDELPLYCMNRYDGGRLSGSSITIGFGCDTVLRREEGNIFSCDDAAIAARLEEGCQIAFRQSGLTDFSLFFGRCDNLRLENIRVEDAPGYAILTEDCCGIRASGVRIIPRRGELAAVSRDGWKIFRCSGRISADDCTFEGTRMDGQNIHTNYFRVKEKQGNRIRAEFKYAPTPIRDGAWIENDQNGRKSEILSWKLLSSNFVQGKQSADPTAGRIVPDRKSRINIYEIETSDASWISIGDSLVVSSMVVDEYICRNSVFRNIAGCGQIVKARSAMIENCRYEDLMCPGVLAGAEMDTHAEGMVPESVTVKDSVFIRTGYYPRYGSVADGAVAAVSQGTDGLSCRSLVLVNNRFISCRRGVELRNAEGLTLDGNDFTSTAEPVLMTGRKTK